MSTCWSRFGSIAEARGSFIVQYNIYLDILGCWACCRQGRGESYPDSYPGKLQIIIKFSRSKRWINDEIGSNIRDVINIFHHYVIICTPIFSFYPKPSSLRGLKKKTLCTNSVISDLIVNRLIYRLVKKKCMNRSRGKEFEKF